MRLNCRKRYNHIKAWCTYPIYITESEYKAYKSWSAQKPCNIGKTLKLVFFKFRLTNYPLLQNTLCFVYHVFLEDEKFGTKKFSFALCKIRYGSYRDWAMTRAITLMDGKDFNITLQESFYNTCILVFQ